MRDCLLLPLLFCSVLAAAEEREVVERERCIVDDVVFHIEFLPCTVSDEHQVDYGLLCISAPPGRQLDSYPYIEVCADG